MTTMWLMLPRAALAGDAPAAGNAVSASNDASAAGTMIRTRGLIKFLLPVVAANPNSLCSLLRDAVEEIKKIRLRLCLPRARLGLPAPNLASFVLAQPQVEAARQHHQVRDHARDHEDPGGDLLIDEWDRVEGRRGEGEDHAEDAELG